MADLGGWIGMGEKLQGNSIYVVSQEMHILRFKKRTSTLVEWEV